MHSCSQHTLNFFFVGVLLLLPLGLFLVDLFSLLALKNPCLKLLYDPQYKSLCPELRLQVIHVGNITLCIIDTVIFFFLDEESKLILLF